MGLALIVCLLLGLGQIVSLALCDWRLRRAPRPFPAPRRAPPVSVVVPLRGLEPFTRETLAAAFALDYPSYELIFCVARPDDAVIGPVERAMAAHPGTPSRLLIGDDVISANPKLNNCVKGWDAARHDWIVLADSNVLMPPDYLHHLLAAWRPDSGLVCSPPLGSRPQGLWAEVECAFLNTLQARWQYTAESLGIGFAQGKSMLWRRELLDRRGGIRALAADIAEDAAATKIVREAGFHVHLVDAPFSQPLGRRTAQQVWLRQLRWARLRRVTFAPVYAPEIFTGAAFAMVMAALVASPAGALAAFAAALVVMVLFHAGEILLARRNGWHVSWRTPFALMMRDALLPALWVGGWIGGNVVWQGQAIHVGKAVLKENTAAV